MILFMLLLRKEEVTDFPKCQKYNLECVFICIHLSLRPWNKTIQQSVMHTLVFLPHKKCLLLGSFTLLLSWSRKFAPLCCGPSYNVCNYFARETASVPDSVKAELLQRIRSFLMSTSLR